MAEIPDHIRQRIAATAPDNIAGIALPEHYSKLTRRGRAAVREAYVEQQAGLCHHCKAPLAGPPAIEVARQFVNEARFPPGFFSNRVHLHHDHKTDLTLGAVHAHCNAVLWQYHGE